MKLLFKQRIFSWFDSYDIYDESGATVFTVQGRLAWGKRLDIHDAQGCYLGRVKQVILTLLPSFEMYLGERYIGRINKELTFLKPKFSLDCNGWRVGGNWLEWDYEVTDAQGRPIAAVSKQLFKLADTYVIDVNSPADALIALMIVLAIDAVKDNR
jgi:uncharacterized protein YxjI